MNDINNKLKPTYYFISLFLLIISIDVLAYMLLPILENNIAFLLIGIFNIILDVILWLCVQHGFNWARWTFVISLIMKSGILISSTLDDLFTIIHFNIKYILLLLYVLIILILSFAKNIREYYISCSMCNYYLEQCKEYAKSRYDIPIILNKQFNINSFSKDVIVISAQSVMDNYPFSIVIKNNMIYDDYFEHYFSNQINSKIKYEIKNYASKSNESYASKLLNIYANRKLVTYGLELNIDSSLNLFEEYRTKVPPYEIFYERNSLQNNILNFTYSMIIDSNDLEFNVKYIYLVLQTLKNFNYKFDIINFYDYDKHAVFSYGQTHKDSNYVIKEMSYSEACNILMNQDLSYIKEKVHSYIINVATNSSLSHFKDLKSISAD